jgi:type I restriction enzyme S subunit
MNKMDIPNSWKTMRLDEIGMIFSGSTPSTSNRAFWDGEIVWITPYDLSRLNTPYLSDSSKRITEKGLNGCSARLLPAGSLVISSRAPIGYVALPTVPFCTNQGCKTIKLKSAYHPEFAYYNVLFNIGKVKSLGEGTTFAEISKRALSTVELLFPTCFLEQAKIAEILSTLGRAIEQTEALIAKHQRIDAGLTQDLLTRGIDEHGNLRSETTHAFKDSPLGRIPVQWEACPLGTLIHIKHGYAFSGEFFSDQRNDNVLLTPGNFHVDGGLYFTGRNTKYYTGAVPREFILANGDVVVVMTDLTKEMAILGRTAILHHTDNVLHNQRVGKVCVNQAIEMDTRFLAILMNSDLYRREIKATATGTTVRHTSPAKLLSPFVPRIPLDEQKRIHLRLDALSDGVEHLLEELKKMNLIKTALMQDLLAGKKRVTPLLEPGTTH